MERSPLILMACSGRKLAVPAPAEDLYRGVMYETFRKHVRDDAQPNVVILSALHGFVDRRTRLEPYDQRMTGSRADEMLSALPVTMAGAQWPRSVSELFLVGGIAYRRVMREAVAVLRQWGCVEETISVREVSGAIGKQRSQLGEYLRRLPTQFRDVIGSHPNGTPLYRCAGRHAVGDRVRISYPGLPRVTRRLAQIQELFVGPCGPTACVELLDDKGKLYSMWVSLAQIRAMPTEAGPPRASLEPVWGRHRF